MTDYESVAWSATEPIMEVSMWSNWHTYAYIGIGLILFIGFCLWFFPVYSVWQRKKSGEADLAEANFAEQVAVAEANARLKAAGLNKQAEIIDAEAVANSVNVIGNALKNNEGYLRWQWIKMMTQTENEVIYVPTEANLPILEASKRIVENKWTEQAE